MPDNRFINGQQLALLGNNQGAPVSVVNVSCVAGTSSYKPFLGWQDKVRILWVHGVMTGAGAASDTVKVGDGTNDITDTVDLSALTDKDVFEVGTYDDAYYTVTEAEDITVTTASDATCELYIWVCRI